MLQMGGGGACNQIASYIDRKNREKEHSFSKCRHYDCQDDDPDDVIISGEESEQNALECQCSSSRKSSSVVYKKSNKLRSKYKIEYAREHSATQIMLWLLVFCIGLLFTMMPIFKMSIFNYKKGASIEAATIKTVEENSNAPWVTVNEGSTALFTGKNTGGESKVSETVLQRLLSYVNSGSVWGKGEHKVSKTDGSHYTALTARDFGKLDSTTQNARLLVRLFDNSALAVNKESAVWQAVYRSMDSTKDVLTLYAIDSINICKYDYYYCGYYLGNSLEMSFESLRTTVLSHFSDVKNKYGETYVVRPVDLPGAWQSKTEQGDDYLYDDTSEYMYGSTDGLWVPSESEVGSELWDLNDYDRESGEAAWLRDNSSYQLKPVIYPNGSYYVSSVGGYGGVRPAIHISLTDLANAHLYKISTSVTGYGASDITRILKNNSMTLNPNIPNYLMKNSTTANGTAIITFKATDSTTINSFTLKNESHQETVTVNEGIHNNSTANGICSYDYNWNGVELCVEVSNLSGSTEIIANSSETEDTSKSSLIIDPNGGTLSNGVSSSERGLVNDTYSLPTAGQLTKIGYTLDGYTLSGGGSLNGFTYTFGSTDGTVTAQWTAITYTIAYTLNGGVLANKREEYTIESESYTLPTPTKPGYTFLGWTGSNGSSAQTNVTIASGTIGDKSYTANWESNYAEITLDVTTNSNGRRYIICILDENDNLKQQIMISKSGSTKIEVEKNKKFTILIYESLYMSATIDGETTRKKIYTNGVSDAQTITITVSSASGQVNNWVIV